LRSVDYSDADRIVTLLTDRFGKAAFIARGARRSKKRFGGALQPLGVISAEVTQGAAQLGTLVQAQVTRAFPRILGDLSRLKAGFSALELLRELTAEHEPDAAVFDTALALLIALDAEEVAPERVLLCFEMRLLALLGLAPRLDRCGLCGKLPAAGQAGLFDPRLGHLVCTSCGGAPRRLGGGVRTQLMHAALPDWLNAAQIDLGQRDLVEAREALLAFVEQHVGCSLEAAALFPTTTEDP
jgi:DNA repair protein RecO (recombination protein O)